jgi:protein-S-isoprenylcysteine O-methyltransferase Ste14
VAYIIDSLWGIFLLYWLLHAFGNKKTVYRQSRWTLVLYLAITAVFFRAVLHAPRLRMRILPHTFAVQIAGILICAAGIGLSIWARRVLGTNWSGIPTLKEGHELIREGPYRWVRHPIYTGLLLAATGTVMALAPTLRGLALVLYVGIAMRLKSLHEEKIMLRQFPAEYAAYQREVKALIPFLY